MNIEKAAEYDPHQLNNYNNISEDTTEQENVQQRTVDYEDLEDVW